MLTRALWRALLRRPFRLLGALCLCAAAICAYAGTLMGLGRIDDTTETLYRDLRLHDLDLRVTPQAADGLPDAATLLRLVPGLRAATWRLVAPGTVELSGARTAGAVVLALPPGTRPQVDDWMVVAGHRQSLRPGHPDDVLIDKTFAEDLGLHVGDWFVLRMQGHQRRVEVRSVVISPEFLMNSVDQSFPVPIRGTMAAVVLSQEAVAAELDSPLYNSLAVRLDPLVDRDRVRDALRQVLAEAGAPVQSAVWAADQFSVLCNRNRLQSYRDSLPTFIAVFSGLSFLVVLLVLRRMVHTWHREMATLLAVGVPRWRIALGWTSAALLLFCGAAVLGAGLAFALQARVSEQYLQGTGFPILLHGPSPVPLLRAASLCLLTLVPAALLPLVPLLRQAPAQLMREQVALESAAALLWIQRVDAPVSRWLRLGAPERLGLRNVLRRPLAFLSSLACVTGLLVGAGSNYFFSEGLLRGLTEFLSAQRWDYLVELAVPATRTDTELTGLLRGAAGPARKIAVEPIHGAEALLRFGGQERSYHLVAGHEPGLLRRPSAFVSGSPLRGEGTAEILINLRLSQALGVEVGDELEVQIGHQTSKLVVCGVLGNNLLNQALVGRATLDRLVGHPTLPVAALVAGPAAPALALSLSRMPEVARVVPRAAVAQTSMAGCQVLVQAVRLYGHMSAVLLALLVLILVLTSVTDRAGEYALLRSLGISAGALFRSLLVEVAALSVLALVLGLPLTVLATKVFQRRIMHISDFVPVQVTLAGYAGLALPALAYMLLAVLPALYRALRLPIAAVLRQRSAG